MERDELHASPKQHSQEYGSREGKGGAFVLIWGFDCQPDPPVVSREYIHNSRRKKLKHTHVVCVPGFFSGIVFPSVLDCMLQTQSKSPLCQRHVEGTLITCPSRIGIAWKR